MGSSKSNKNIKAYQRYDDKLIYKLDQMEKDEEYDPYKANRKQTVSDKELFAEDYYKDDDEKDSGDLSNKSMKITIVVVSIVVVLAIIGIFAYIQFG